MFTPTINLGLSNVEYKWLFNPQNSYTASQARNQGYQPNNLTLVLTYRIVGTTLQIIKRFKIFKLVKNITSIILRNENVF